MYIGGYMLHKKFREAGASWSIIIPKAILQAMNINPVLDEISIEIEGDAIKLKKYREEKEK